MIDKPHLPQPRYPDEVGPALDFLRDVGGLRITSEPNGYWLIWDGNYPEYMLSARELAAFAWGMKYGGRRMFRKHVEVFIATTHERMNCGW